MKKQYNFPKLEIIFLKEDPLRCSPGDDDYDDSWNDPNIFG